MRRKQTGTVIWGVRVKQKRVGLVLSRPSKGSHQNRKQISNLGKIGRCNNHGYGRLPYPMPVPRPESQKNLEKTKIGWLTCCGTGTTRAGLLKNWQPDARSRLDVPHRRTTSLLWTPMIHSAWRPVAWARSSRTKPSYRFSTSSFEGTEGLASSRTGALPLYGAAVPCQSIWKNAKKTKTITETQKESS
jgi:hypothetical protein